MKILKTSLVLLLAAMCATTYAQTIRRVNADPTVTGINVYATIQAAHDAATAGDVLIIEPGPSVGDLNCIKTLTIYGRGYFLDKNLSYSNLPNNASTPTVGTINIYASNCKIMGIAANSIALNGGANGTNISRNKVGVVSLNGSVGAAVNNTIITQNVLTYIFLYPSATGFISNLTISNNEIDGGVTYQVNSNYYSNILVNQNTIYQFSGGSYSAVWSNNIFTGNGVTITTGTIMVSSTFNYNVLFGTSSINAGLGSNNLVLSNDVGQFNANTGGNSDNNYRVAAGSAMKTASSTGGEVGMFGGSTPYVQYGIPAVPSIIKLISTGIGNSTTPITATVTATSNN